MFLKSLKLSNFLSFGETDAWVDLRPLNVIIGPNGAGKSNFIEAISFIRSASGLADNNNLLAAIARGGGVENWIWKGTRKKQHASLDAIFDGQFLEFSESIDMHYSLSFVEARKWFQIIDERVTKCTEKKTSKSIIPNYCIENGRGVLRSADNGYIETPMDFIPTQSILSQRAIPSQHQEIMRLINGISGTLIYNNWTFGYYSPPRLFQHANAQNSFLDSDASNLGMVINKIRGNKKFREKFFHYLGKVYDGIIDFDVKILQGMLQVELHEKSGIVIPATQLSDGTLRYMSLLAVLCDPEPRPLVCIEEPELGLHPDIIPYFADLLEDASERTQLVVTTHSDFLVDALSDQPEAILVAERDENGTSLKRLDSGDLKLWLEEYRLGELWISGQIGGKRWR